MSKYIESASEKSGHITLNYLSCKYSPDSCVSIGFKSDAELPLFIAQSNLEESVIVFMLFKMLENKLTKDTKAHSLYKLISACCGSANNMAVMSFQCPASYGNVKRLVKALVRNLKSITMNASFKGVFQGMYNVKPNKGNFEVAMNKIADSINKSLYVAITGRPIVKSGDDKLKLLAKDLNDTFKSMKKITGAKAGTKTVAEGDSLGYKSIMKVGNGLDAFIMSNYIRKVLHNGHIHLMNGAFYAKHDVGSLGSKDKLNKHIKEHFRIKETPLNCLVHHAISSCALAPDQVKKPSITEQSVKSALTKFV